jgi:hypothetical protein
VPQRHARHADRTRRVRRLVAPNRHTDSFVLHPAIVGPVFVATSHLAGGWSPLHRDVGDDRRIPRTVGPMSD